MTTTITFTDKEDLILRVCKIYKIQYKTPQKCFNDNHYWRNQAIYYELYNQRLPNNEVGVVRWFCKRCVKELLGTWTNQDVEKVVLEGEELIYEQSNRDSNQGTNRFAIKSSHLPK